MRTIAGCAVLVGLAFVQTPGLIIADTKFDLAINPVGFLERAMHIWDPLGAFGQLQNQAYGYLWPMGPFFALGDLIALPSWVVQRLWLALVLCVAFIGAVRLVRALGVRSDLAALVAGFAYATSPRMLSTLGPISIEAWPSSLAPWVLLPLVVGASRGSPRRMAAWSGLAIGMVGGVNAAATAAVLPLGALWLLTRQPGPRRRRLMLWWPVFTAMATLWWLVPLFLLGAYSPPFLDYIETAAVTTYPTTLFDALRGTSAWTPYIDSELRGGNELITQGYLALNSGILLMLGLLGLALRANPHRRFLVLALLTGLTLVTMGHLGTVQGWFAQPLHDVLDTVLNPLRNVHKFDPVVRLPLIVGLAWTIQAARDGAPGRLDLRGRSMRVPAGLGIALLSVVGTVGAAMPLVNGHVAPLRPVEQLPDYWESTAQWLEQNDDGAVALLAPGSSFATYLWGGPDDEPLQFLATSRWAVRDAIPLAPAGTIRMLDAIETRLLQGQPSDGLAPYLRRAGIGHVVVRNDLAPTDDAAHPVMVHQALENSPGLRRVTSFGPYVGGDAVVVEDGRRVVIESGWQERRQAVEIYRVDGKAPLAVTARETPLVAGGPEDLLDLADHGLLDDTPAVLAVDATVGDGAGRDVLLTDGLVARERFFGRVHDAAAAATTPGDVERTANRRRDYQIDDDSGRWSTSVRLRGATGLSASSSASDAGAFGGSRPGELPFAAVDGDLATSWVTDPGSEKRPWWRIDLDRARTLARVTVVVGPEAPERTVLRVRTEAGVSDVIETGPDRSRTVRVPRGPTRWIEVESADPRPHRLSLREVFWTGSDVRRQLVLPDLPKEWGSPERVLLRRMGDARTGCVRIEDRVPCRTDAVGSAEEPAGFERVIPSAYPRTYDLEVSAVPRPGAELDAALQQGLTASVFSSSTGVDDPRASGIAAFDGDAGTSWVAAADDPRPRLGLSWVGTRPVTQLTLSVSPDAPVRRPTEVLLQWPGGERVVSLDGAGRGGFPTIDTDRLSIEILEDDGAIRLDNRQRAAGLPVGISEINVEGVGFALARPDAAIRRWPCGSGPTVAISGSEHRTRLVASPLDLFRMGEVRAEVCGGSPTEARLRSGDNLVVAAAASFARPQVVVLTSGDAAEAVAPAKSTVFGPAETRHQVEPDQELLAMRQNNNPGWRAAQDGATLAPVVVDGWQQGWWLTGSPGAVHVEFPADRLYRVGLLGGLGLFALLAALLLFLPARRWPGADLAPRGRERVPTTLVIAATIAGAGMVAGWAGAGITFGVLAMLVLLRARWGDAAGEAAGWMAAAGVVVAATVYQLRPWGSDSGWAGNEPWVAYLMLFSLVTPLLLAVRPRLTVARRMNGSSTQR